MQSESNENKPGLAWALTVGFALLAVGSRLLPRLLENTTWPWGLTAVGALGLFAGARLRSRVAFLVPLATMLVSDLLLWKLLADRNLPTFGWLTPFHYGFFLVYALIGRFLTNKTSPSWRNKTAPLWIGAAGVAGSTQFFVLSNFAVWAIGDGATFPKTLSGLVECYIAGLPFYRNMMVGDIGFSALFFGLYAVLLHVTERQKVSQPA
jgi:hypothetical protein